MKINAYLKLARVPEGVLLPLFSVTISYLAASNGTIRPDVIIPVMAAILGTGGMCALNDYFDVEADKFGAKERPLPSGKISLKNGLAFAIILTITGMTVAGLSSTILLPIVGGLAVMFGLIYNWKTKGRGFWGTATFGFIMVTTVSLGITQAKSEFSFADLLLYLIFVFFTAAGNQLTANFYDFESDKRYGYHTIPNMYGIKKGARIVVGIRTLGFITLLVYLSLNGMLNAIVGSGLVLIAALILLAFHFLNRAHEKKYAKIAFKLSVGMTLFSFCTIMAGIYLTPH